MVYNRIIPLRNVDEMHVWENRPFSGAVSTSKPSTSKPDTRIPIKKKIKRNRTAFTTSQVQALEHLFSQNKYISTEERQEIAKSMNLVDKSIKVWFQNRRMKEKREAIESSQAESDSSNGTIMSTCCKHSSSSSIESQPPSVASMESLDRSPAVATTERDPPEEDIIMNEDLAPTNHYQFPQYYAQNSNEQFQNVSSIDYTTWHNNGMHLYNETNIYPTQYYPDNNSNYQSNFNYYHQQGSSFQSYCGSNSFLPGFYYNEES